MRAAACLNFLELWYRFFVGSQTSQKFKDGVQMATIADRILAEAKRGGPQAILYAAQHNDALEQCPTWIASQLYFQTTYDEVGASAMMAISPVTGNIATQDMEDEANRISKEAHKPGLRVRSHGGASSSGSGDSSGKGKGKKGKKSK